MLSSALNAVLEFLKTILTTGTKTNVRHADMPDIDPILVSSACDFIKSFEGFRASPYLPTPEDRPTIGYGTTFYTDYRPVQMADSDVTEDQAYTILEFFVSKAVETVQGLVIVSLTDNQIVALTSFEYNTGHLKGSTLLELLNEGHYVDASNQFDRWDHQDGKVIDGLLTRRDKEKELFLE